MAGRIALVCALLVGLTAEWLHAQGPIEGQPAPDFSASNVLGKQVKLSSFRGSNVVLVFTRAHW